MEPSNDPVIERPSDRAMDQLSDKAIDGSSDQVTELSNSVKKRVDTSERCIAPGRGGGVETRLYSCLTKCEL